VAAFDLYILEILCGINMDQAVGINKNNLQGKRLEETGKECCSRTP
jgi:hypothetical protein